MTFEGDPTLEEGVKLLGKLKELLRNESVLNKALADFQHVFHDLGLTEEDSRQLSSEIVEILEKGDNLENAEEYIFKQLSKTKTKNGQNLVKSLNEKLSERSKIIAEQISPHLGSVTGKVLDFGAGDGRIAQTIHNEFGLDIEGVDVRDYKSTEVSIPLKVFDGEHLAVPDNTYQAAIMTNVLHHELDNEKIIRELSRVVKDRIVVIETIPAGDDEDEMKGDYGRTFLNDYLYNRLFHNANISVPGTYETPEGWVARFARHGWKVAFERDLGFDQPVIRDRHYLFVFEKIQN
ncbi:MAG: class I SAM-dependent methyltransferase [Patescibacteria group bacterium]